MVVHIESHTHFLCIWNNFTPEYTYPDVVLRLEPFGLVLQEEWIEPLKEREIQAILESGPVSDSTGQVTCPPIEQNSKQCGIITAQTWLVRCKAMLLWSDREEEKNLRNPLTNQIPVRTSILGVPVPRCIRWPECVAAVVLGGRDHVPAVGRVFSISQRTALIHEMRSLRSRLREQISPRVRIVHLSFEHWRKIGVGESRRVVLFHVLNNFWVLPNFPVIPEPLVDDAGDWV